MERKFNNAEAGVRISSYPPSNRKACAVYNRKYANKLLDFTLHYPDTNRDIGGKPILKVFRNRTKHLMKQQDSFRLERMQFSRLGLGFAVDIKRGLLFSALLFHVTKVKENCG
jgi:hypothetical protein